MNSDFAAALTAGLAATPKTIPPKFFYDREGSHLFDQICALPEYYPTRTEMALLDRHAPEFARLIGPCSEIVEFGAGAAAKIRILLDMLDQPRAYVPIDISGDYLAEMVRRLQPIYEDVLIKPVIGDFSQTFDLPPMQNGARRRIGFFPGSTIGNFDPEEAVDFLRRAAAMLAGGGLLIGVDLVKDPTILHAAYNDAAGVTAQFNKNLLVRANRELGADFDPTRFAHYALYNPLQHRIEMYLVSLARQTVRSPLWTVPFEEGEAILTEYSHKYTVAGFQALAEAAGFRPIAVWTDAARHQPPLREADLRY